MRVEVKRLTEVADKTARDLEGFKVNKCRVEKQWSANKKRQDDKKGLFSIL